MTDTGSHQTDIINQYHAENMELRSEKEALARELEDWKDGCKNIMAEPCLPDEKHCTCVPHLRAEVQRLGRELEEAKKRIALLDKCASELQQAATAEADQKDDMARELERVKRESDAAHKFQWDRADKAESDRDSARARLAQAVEALMDAQDLIDDAGDSLLANMTVERVEETWGKVKEALAAAQSDAGREEEGMTHRETYQKLKQARALLAELRAAKVAPYQMDKILQQINEEIRHTFVLAGLDAVGADESLQWALER